MSQPHRSRLHGEARFTRADVLVAVLIAAVLAAIAIPSVLYPQV